MRDARPDYPPEYDYPDICDVCNKPADDCDCPECPVCGAQGDSACYGHHDLKPAHDSIQAFCDHIGIEPLQAALRAIDRHNTVHVWVVTVYGERLTYGSPEGEFEVIPTWTRLAEVGVGGIAWDGSDWEWGKECEAGGDWSQLDGLREEFHEALEEYEATKEEP